jgi:hypothetical protein
VFQRGVSSARRQSPVAEIRIKRGLLIAIAQKFLSLPPALKIAL